MTDEHVESLRYSLKTDGSLEFDDPPPLEHETDALHLRLDGNDLTVWPKAKFASEEDAKEMVDGYLRAWEVYEGLLSGRPSVRFEFRSARIVDHFGSETSAYVVSRFATLRSVRRDPERRSTYPKPPRAFAASPDAEAMWQRYEQYLRGHEPLLSMGYACLTRIEFAARNAPVKGSRRKVEHVYGIEEAVLRKLGEFTTNLGDEVEARKVHAGSKNRPPNDRERVWIEATVRALVRRSGEYDADPKGMRSRLTMADLPDL